MHNDDQVQINGSIKFASAGPPLQGDMSMITSMGKLLLKFAVFLEHIGKHRKTIIINLMLLCRLGLMIINY